ncbi:TPA: hypothetical protein ACN1ND_000300 [Enterococcus faecalis]|nr:hypothetical protein [Enterococcus faecalis]EKQ3613548.1 hypothetical protein [Enterococcus faecalis]
MPNIASQQNKELLDKKRKIRQLRKELYHLMASDEQWFKNENSSLYKQIVSCGQDLKRIECANKHMHIDERDYQTLRSLGFTLSEIANHFCISSFRLNKWRPSHHIKN